MCLKLSTTSIRMMSARDLATINLGYTRISAPVEGMVGERQVRPGQYLSVGTQVISLVPLPNVWVIANYKETQMTNIRTGQKARVTVDAFDARGEQTARPDGALGNAAPVANIRAAPRSSVGKS